MPKSSNSMIAVIGIDLGKNTFHVIGLDNRGRIVFRRKFTRSSLEARMHDHFPWSVSLVERRTSMR